MPTAAKKEQGALARRCRARPPRHLTYEKHGVEAHEEGAGDEGRQRQDGRDDIRLDARVGDVAALGQQPRADAGDELRQAEGRPAMQHANVDADPGNDEKAPKHHRDVEQHQPHEGSPEGRRAPRPQARQRRGEEGVREGEGARLPEGRVPIEIGDDDGLRPEQREDADDGALQRGRHVHVERRQGGEKRCVVDCSSRGYG